MGIVSVSPIPTLAKGESFTVEVTAKPDDSLFIFVRNSSNHEIARIRLTSEVDTQSFVLTPNITGFDTLTYSHEGRDTRNFASIPASSFFVTNARVDVPSNEYFDHVRSPIGQLKEGCCKIVYRGLGTCNTDNIQLKSSCQWASGESPGVIFVRARGFSLPYSVSGASVKSMTITLPSGLPQCDGCSTRGSPPSGQQCYQYNFTAGDTQNFLMVRALPLTYFTAISPMLPSWISSLTIDMELVNPNVTSFALYDSHTDLLYAQSVLGLKGCENLELKVPFRNRRKYSVLRYGRTITATVDGQVLSYPDPTSVDIPMCFAVNLCQGTSSPLHIGLSPETASIVVSELLRQYTDSGWIVNIASVVLNNPGIITGEYWNGIAFSEPSVGTFDFSMKAGVEASLQLGSLAIEWKVTGKLLCQYEVSSNILLSPCMFHLLIDLLSFVQSRTGVASGSTGMTVNTTYGGIKRSLSLADQDSTSTYVDFTGNTSHYIP